MDKLLRVLGDLSNAHRARKNGGLRIPEKWQKWHKARYENANVPELV